jgi:acid phosphatase (class A)
LKFLWSANLEYGPNGDPCLSARCGKDFSMRSGILGLALSLALMTAAGAHEPNFVFPDQLSPLTLLPAPPANDSPQTKAELAELHRIEANRTQAEISQAQADDVEEDIFIFKKVLGPGFTAAALPLTASLSARLHDEESIFANIGKVSWNRPRPPALDTTLHPICKLSRSGAYPSGHTTTGYLEGLILAAMVPEKHDAIFGRLEEYAHSRLVCGVHYPSDLDASKRLAYAMVGLILNSPKFKAEFEPARAELRHALGLPQPRGD